MSNKFGEFWYIPTIDKDGFDIHGANGIVDFETTSEKAIVNCQRRYIAELEANLASALEVSRIKGEELAAAIAENEGLQKQNAALRKENNALIAVRSNIDALMTSIQYLEHFQGTTLASKSVNNE